MIKIRKLRYTISYTNLRNLRANVPEVKLHNFEFKLDLIFLSEIGIHRTEEASNPGLFTRNSWTRSPNRRAKRISAYIKHGFSRNVIKKEPYFSYMCFCRARIHITISLSIVLGAKGQKFSIGNLRVLIIFSPTFPQIAFTYAVTSVSTTRSC